MQITNNGGKHAAYLAEHSLLWTCYISDTDSFLPENIKDDAAKVDIINHRLLLAFTNHVQRLLDINVDTTITSQDVFVMIDTGLESAQLSQSKRFLPLLKQCESFWKLLMAESQRSAQLLSLDLVSPILKSFTYCLSVAYDLRKLHLTRSDANGTAIFLELPAPLFDLIIARFPQEWLGVSKTWYTRVCSIVSILAPTSIFAFNLDNYFANALQTLKTPTPFMQALLIGLKCIEKRLSPIVTDSDEQKRLKILKLTEENLNLVQRNFEFYYDEGDGTQEFSDSLVELGIKTFPAAFLQKPYILAELIHDNLPQSLKHLLAQASFMQLFVFDTTGKSSLPRLLRRAIKHNHLDVVKIIWSHLRSTDLPLDWHLYQRAIIGENGARSNVTCSVWLVTAARGHCEMLDYFIEQKLLLPTYSNNDICLPVAVAAAAAPNGFLDDDDEGVIKNVTEKVNRWLTKNLSKIYELTDIQLQTLLFIALRTCNSALVKLLLHALQNESKDTIPCLSFDVMLLSFICDRRYAPVYENNHLSWNDAKQLDPLDHLKLLVNDLDCKKTEQLHDTYRSLSAHGFYDNKKMDSVLVAMLQLYLEYRRLPSVDCHSANLIRLCLQGSMGALKWYMDNRQFCVSTTDLHTAFSYALHYLPGPCCSLLAKHPNFIDYNLTSSVINCNQPCCNYTCNYWRKSVDKDSNDEVDDDDSFVPVINYRDQGLISTLASLDRTKIRFAADCTFPADVMQLLTLHRDRLCQLGEHWLHSQHVQTLPAELVQNLNKNWKKL